MKIQIRPSFGGTSVEHSGTTSPVNPEHGPKTSSKFKGQIKQVAFIFRTIPKHKVMAQNIGEIENLQQQEAIDKMKELVDHNVIAISQLN